MADSNDLSEFIKPPLEVDYPFRLWQAWALRLTVPSLVVAFGASGLTYAIIANNPPIGVFSTFILGHGAGVFLTLCIAYNQSLTYADKIIAQRNDSLGAFLSTQQVSAAVKAGKGSQVTIEQNVNAMTTQTTYQADAAYRLALLMVKLMFVDAGHRADGAKTLKPVSMQAVNSYLKAQNEAQVRYERWREAAKLIEEAGIGEVVDSYALHIPSEKGAEEALRRAMLARGFWQVNGNWQRR